MKKITVIFMSLTLMYSGVVFAKQDKVLINHKGREILVAAASVDMHIAKHGDTIVGDDSCAPPIDLVLTPDGEDDAFGEQELDDCTQAEFDILTGFGEDPVSFVSTHPTSGVPLLCTAAEENSPGLFFGDGTVSGTLIYNCDALNE